MVLGCQPHHRVAQEDTRNNQSGPNRSRVGASILRSCKCRIQDPRDSGASSRHGYGRKEASPGPALGWAPYGLVPIGQQSLPRVPCKTSPRKGRKEGFLEKVQRGPQCWGGANLGHWGPGRRP